MTLDVLNIVFDRIDKCFLDDAFREKLILISDNVPLLRHGIIELYSSPKSKRVDLMLCVQKRFNEHRLLSSYLKNKDYHYLNDLFNIWSDKDQLLSGILENIYVVYDIVDLQKDIDPWPYLAFSKLSLDPTVLLSIFKSSASALRGSWNEYIETKLLMCLSHAGTDLHVFGFGMLEGRDKGGFRIGISNFKTIEQIGQYMKKIGWQIDYEKFCEKLSRLNKLTESFVLSLVMEEEKNGIIGIECVLPKTNNKQHAEQLLCYLGIDDSNELLNAISESDSIKTWVNHIKINWEESTVSSIKTYLYYEVMN